MTRRGTLCFASQAISQYLVPQEPDVLELVLPLVHLAVDGRSWYKKCSLEWVGVLRFDWPWLAIRDDFLEEAGLQDQVGAWVKVGEGNGEQRVRLVRSGTLLREGPEVGVASMGLGAAGTPGEVASHQLCPLGLQDDEDLQVLLKGSQLLKVKSNSWRRERFYKLQEDCKTIWQESRKVMRTPESHLCECPRAAGWEQSVDLVLAGWGRAQ